MIRFSFLFLILTAALSVSAKDFSSWRKYTRAELVSETTSFVPGVLGAIGVKIHLEPKWHTYWLNPGDSGTPIHLSFKTSKGVEIRHVLFPAPIREQTGPLISFVYENEVLLPITVEISRNLKPGDVARIDVSAEWLICVDICIPAFDNLHIEVPITDLKGVQNGADFGLFQKMRRNVPRVNMGARPFEFKANDSQVILNLPQDLVENQLIDFFPFHGSGVTNGMPKFVRPGVLSFEKSNVAPDTKAMRIGVLMSKDPNGVVTYEQLGQPDWSFDLKDEGGARSNTLWMLLSAFIGGLILNLMPCVFPILSMKLLSLLKLVEAHPKEVRMQNVAYVAGVLISFVSVALLLSLLRSAGHLVGWGFQLQSPVFIVLLSWLFFALSLNLLGLYEIDLIDAGVGSHLTRVGGIWGSFFTGVLAVVVASPCTAPFMGVALGFGLAQPTAILIAVFFALGLGLSFPYLVFVLFPSWIRFLPRPGMWMKHVKQVVAVPLLLTTAWLLWILMQVRGATAVFVVVIGCLVFTLAVLFSSRKWMRFVTAIVLAAGLVFIYQSSSSSSEKVDEGPWQAYSEARMASLKGKNLFVNMTADWCLTCKVNERLVFDDPEVRALLIKKNVIWLKGDWTERNEEITRFLNNFDRVGVPFYVLYSTKDPNGTPLPEVLTKASFMDLIEKEFPVP